MKRIQAIPYPEYTTTQRDALTNVLVGYKIRNTTTNTFQMYTDSGWIDIYVVGSGGLTFPLSFDNTNLVDNVLTVTHNLSAELISIDIWDDLGNPVGSQYLPEKTDEDISTIDFGDVITGTWYLIVTKRKDYVPMLIKSKKSIKFFSKNKKTKSKK